MGFKDIFIGSYKKDNNYLFETNDKGISPMTKKLKLLDYIEHSLN